MFNKQMSTFLKFMFILLLFGTCKLGAQDTTSSLVIRQVYLDKNQPSNSWIEIYNPSDKLLVLERMRESHFLTINYLPQSIQSKGGIEIRPGEYIILCADSNSFRVNYGKEIKCILIDALKYLSTGGFLLIHTKGAGETKGDVVRYGEPAQSVGISKLAGYQVVGFSKDGKSFVRKIIKTQSGIDFSDFFETSDLPGKTD